MSRRHYYRWFRRGYRRGRTVTWAPVCPECGSREIATLDRTGLGGLVAILLTLLFLSLSGESKVATFLLGATLLLGLGGYIWVSLAGRYSFACSKCGHQWASNQG